ncbi:MAG: phenylacetic acid degradation operon negative regulatory protein PaaX [Steroidobacteraceae bacterium]
MTTTVESTTRSLVRNFGRQRPLRAGSLLVTIFGDSIAPRGGVITLRSLIELAAPFGLTERLVRTSVSRLADDGWLTSRRRGRLSEYRLARTGADRFARATSRIYAAPRRQWDGRLTVAIAHRERRGVNAQLAQSLSWEGFAQIARGVLVSAAHDASATRQIIARAGLAGDVHVLTACDERSQELAQIVRSGWNLDELAARYRSFLKRFAPLARTVAHERSVDPRCAFVLRTLLIHEFRKVELRDPLLPAALLPDDWAGHDAYALCRRVYRWALAPAERFLSATACRLDGSLPPADPALFRRFQR